MSVDEDGMTTEERRLFDDLVERITANKSEVLDVLAGESPVSDDAPVSDGTSVPDASGTADAPPLAEESAQASGPEADRAGSEPTPTDPEPGVADPDPPSADLRTADAEDASTDAGALAGAMGGGEGDPAGGDGSTGRSDVDATSGVSETGNDEAGRRETTQDGADGLTADASADDADEGTGATTDGGSMPDATTGSGSEASADRATVRITRDVGAIFGVDEREYDLASEDVVSLPVENADPLVQRDAAERLD
jgi:DNA replication factor GINS